MENTKLEKGGPEEMMGYYEQIHRACETIDPATLPEDQVENKARELIKLIRATDEYNGYELRIVRATTAVTPRILPTRTDYEALELVKIIKHCLCVRAGWCQPMSTGNADHQRIINRTIAAIER